MRDILIEHLTEGWVETLGPFLFSQECERLLKQLAWLYKNKKINPELKNVFRIFRLLKPEDVRAVIVGMDPYQRPGEATGIAMGVEGIDYLPPTLQVMFKEIERDFGYQPSDTSLLNWVNQGVMMLNSALTVEQGKSGSHEEMWFPFMRNFFMEFSKKRGGIVYVFMGKKAQFYGRYVECFLNDLLKTSHPVADVYTKKSMFYGCGIFSEINRKLPSETPILW